MTAWSEDLLDHKKNVWCQQAALLPGTEQESWLGTAGLGAHLLFCFAINSELPHDPATPFLGAHGNGKSSVSPSPEEQHRLIPQKSLKFGVLKLNHMPETKKISDTGRVNARFRWKLETQEE